MTSIIKVNNIQNSSGTAAVTIDGNGIITTPQIPAFRVIGPTSALTNQNLTSGYLDITWWEHSPANAFINNSSDFNTSTGKYTVPVTGKYQYDINVSFENVSSGYYSFWMQINGSHAVTQPFAITDPTAGSAKDTLNHSGLLSLTAGQVIHWTHKGDPDTSITFPASFSTWSMYLVG